MHAVFLNQTLSYILQFYSPIIFSVKLGVIVQLTLDDLEDHVCLIYMINCS